MAENLLEEALSDISNRLPTGYGKSFIFQLFIIANSA
jgi:superfamily II DNA helicase RecQ